MSRVKDGVNKTEEGGSWCLQGKGDVPRVLNPGQSGIESRPWDWWVVRVVLYVLPSSRSSDPPDRSRGPFRVEVVRSEVYSWT